VIIFATARIFSASGQCFDQKAVMKNFSPPRRAGRNIGSSEEIVGGIGFGQLAK
jgi:hypothetical protein